MKEFRNKLIVHGLMKINDKYCRVVFLRNYGTFVSDDTIAELTSINRNLMLSVDFLPTPTDEATKEVDKVLLGIQTEKANYNRKQVQNQNLRPHGLQKPACLE